VGRLLPVKYGSSCGDWGGVGTRWGLQPAGRKEGRGREGGAVSEAEEPWGPGAVVGPSSPPGLSVALSMVTVYSRTRCCCFCDISCCVRLAFSPLEKEKLTPSGLLNEIVLDMI
jgi:hypothetical protein